jgi:energy-converting hydrogenase Eha subunit G
MNGSLLHQIPASLPGLGLILQGAATGALIASIVLCRARRRDLHVEPWAVTAAWSTVGAAVAVVGVLIAFLT